MKTALQFDFSVNKENKTINVVRAFDADLNLVWDAWTKPELLDQWWAPKPYKAVTKSMDFREGGHWIYAMTCPGQDNLNQFSRCDFQRIDMRKSFSSLVAFCDENGNPVGEWSKSVWTNRFEPTADETVVNITLAFDRLEVLEKMVEMGFKEGFSMALGNLDELLAQA
jgi:uncharacterized protein YndB with AHSA1/START domain